MFWPHYADEIVAAYAALVDVPAIVIWRRAIAAWDLEGEV